MSSFRADSEGPNRKQILDPVERISEVLFGLIMAVTFTGTISVANSGASDVRDTLYAALACNLAWGFVDAVMYVITGLVGRGRAFRVVSDLGHCADPNAGRRIVIDAMPLDLGRRLSPQLLDQLRAGIAQSIPELPRPRLTFEDLAGAIGIFFIVALSTLPPVLPFLFISDVFVAMRVSNAIVVLLLFVSGFALGHYADFSPWWSAGIMTSIGAVLVGVTIVLGG